MADFGREFEVYKMKLNVYIPANCKVSMFYFICRETFGIFGLRSFLTGVL